MSLRINELSINCKNFVKKVKEKFGGNEKGCIFATSKRKRHADKANEF